MRLFRLAVVVVPLFLAACGLSDQQKADYASVQRAGVSSAIYDKMVHGDTLSLYDIKALSRAGVSDAVIIRYIRDHGTAYYLSSDDVTGLRKAGVSQSVVDFMMATPGYYGAAAYPPPIAIGIGYGPYWGGPWWGGPYWGGGYCGYHGGHR